MKRRPRRSTPAGTHRPGLRHVTVAILRPVLVSFADCTAGYGGHASALLCAVGPSAKSSSSISIRRTWPRASQRLAAIGHPFEAHHLNFAGLATAVAGQMLDRRVGRSGHVEHASRRRGYAASAIAGTDRSTCGWTRRVDVLPPNDWQSRPTNWLCALRDLGDDPLRLASPPQPVPPPCNYPGDSPSC
jgi:hypothetical protein